MLKKYIFILAVSILLGSCVDPLNIESDSFTKVLIVEGGVNTFSGPHSISLSQSAKYGSVFNDGVITPVLDAQVTIRDDEGNNEILIHSGSGQYITSPEFKGEVGKGYILIIDWNEKTYNSTQQFIEKSSQIDSLYPVYNEVPFLNENGILNFKGGVDVYATYEQQENTADYYLWDFEGVYYVRTFPELFMLATRRGLVSRPKECCSDCYKTEVNDDIIISSFPLGNSEVNSKLFFLEDDGYRFSDKYVMTIIRQSMPQEAYEFYNLIKLQLQIDGDIFDPPPATIRGNILNIDDSDELVVGYFLTSDITIDTVSVSKSAIPNLAQLPIFPDDCQVLPNTSIVKPDIYDF